MGKAIEIDASEVVETACCKYCASELWESAIQSGRNYCMNKDCAEKGNKLVRFEVAKYQPTREQVPTTITTVTPNEVKTGSLVGREIRTPGLLKVGKIIAEVTVSLGYETIRGFELDNGELMTIRDLDQRKL